MTTPLRVTVVIPAYNAGRWIDDALASVAAQTRPAHEVVVVDDGSTDDTAARSRSWAGRMGTTRLIVFEGVRRGLSPSRNLAMMAGTGELFALLDADDCFAPWHLERLVPAFETEPGLALVFADMTRFEDETGDRELVLRKLHADLRRISTPIAGTSIQRLGPELREIYLRVSAIPPSSCIVTREAVVRGGLFDPASAYAEDLDFLWRILGTGPGAWHDGSTGRKREHGSNASGPARAEWAEREVLRAVSRLRSFAPKLTPGEKEGLDWHLRSTLQTTEWLAAGHGIRRYFAWWREARRWTGRPVPIRPKQLLRALLRWGR